MEKNEIISSGLLELYVAGLTTTEETRQVQDWAALYPEVATELAAIETAVEAQAMANALAPAAQVKDRIMAALATDKQAVTKETLPLPPIMSVVRPTSHPIWKWMAAASVALLLVGAYMAYGMYNKNKQYETQLAQSQQRLDSSLANSKLQQEQFLTGHHHMEAVMAGDIAAVALHKTDKAPDDCAAKVFWNKKTGEVFIDPCQMIAAPSGKTYQLWAIVNGKPVDAGLVKTGSVQDKFSIQKMKEFKEAQAFAITLEKEGGSAIPTLEQTYVVGEV